MACAVSWVQLVDSCFHRNNKIIPYVHPRHSKGSNLYSQKQPARSTSKVNAASKRTRSPFVPPSRIRQTLGELLNTKAKWREYSSKTFITGTKHFFQKNACFNKNIRLDFKFKILFQNNNSFLFLKRVLRVSSFFTLNSENADVSRNKVSCVFYFNSIILCSTNHEANAK